VKLAVQIAIFALHCIAMQFARMLLVGMMKYDVLVVKGIDCRTLAKSRAPTPTPTPRRALPRQLDAAFLHFAHVRRSVNRWMMDDGRDPPMSAERVRVEEGCASPMDRSSQEQNTSREGRGGEARRGVKCKSGTISGCRDYQNSILYHIASSIIL
jgi:hypothetical protein